MKTKDKFSEQKFCHMKPQVAIHIWWKKRSERRKHCALAVVTRSQKFSPHRIPPSRGRRTAKI